MVTFEFWFPRGGGGGKNGLSARPPLCSQIALEGFRILNCTGIGFCRREFINDARNIFLAMFLFN